MDLSSKCKLSRLFACNLTSIICKCLALVTIALFFRAILYHLSSGDVVLERDDLDLILGRSMLSQSDEGIRRHKFLEVPQLVWGLNNQKIAFVRACLTARMLNRTLLMPSLSASLFYKEINRLQPISFDKVFKFERFNILCEGFVQLARYSDLKNRTGVYDL
ncbi:GDP-fucose protein O-fucosyltransferase 1 isoform 1 [Gossypium australe]|uniref:GDP-fucose protein O-fucosyltransferase 1 isoform 1 n=1 Tax=Gossypium australe TaxID=47621 RepID=A0A5B6WD91_9ROSI|nr:GDP-fucose protein O-fucosyltransferase 1 isoform 1 [Gossypium australe]